MYRIATLINFSPKAISFFDFELSFSARETLSRPPILSQTFLNMGREEASEGNSLIQWQKQLEVKSEKTRD